MTGEIGPLYLCLRVNSEAVEGAAPRVTHNQAATEISERQRETAYYQSGHIELPKVTSCLACSRLSA